MRPSSFSCRASKLCAPSDTRVTPAARYSAKLAAFDRARVRLERDLRCPAPRIRLPFARVFDAAGRWPRAKTGSECRRREKRSTSGRPSTSGKLRIEVAQQRVDVALLRQLVLKRVRVEIAVRALLHAPGKVRVQRERRRVHRRATAAARGMPANAWPRWLRSCLRRRRHLRGGARLAARHEDGVVTETAAAARRSAMMRLPTLLRRPEAAASSASRTKTITLR